METDWTSVPVIEARNRLARGGGTGRKLLNLREILKDGLIGFRPRGVKAKYLSRKAPRCLPRCPRVRSWVGAAGRETQV